MSNRRTPIHSNAYRSTFLRSRAWFARRDAWFAHAATEPHPLACVACGIQANKRDLELHHLDYAGVQQLADGRWLARESDGDLIPLHPYCHELLHRLIDRDAVLSTHRTRRVASELALDALRRTLTHTQGAGT